MTKFTSATLLQCEGFARAFDVVPGGVPSCSSSLMAHGFSLSDFRGDVTGGDRNQWFKYNSHLRRNAVEWETAAAEAAEDTVFTWIGGSQVQPGYRPAFPYDTATLYVDGVERLQFPIGRVEGFAPVGDVDGYTARHEGFALHFQPRRFQSLVEGPHRNWMPHGVSGFYRLSVPGRFLEAGRPLRLRVELPPHQEDVEYFFYVSPRPDALKVELAILRDEVEQLQVDMVQVRQAQEMLYAQVYPQLFSNRIAGRMVVAHHDEKKHLHPAQLTVMRDGEIIITAREGSDHLAPDGRIIIVRSQDGGQTWSEKAVMYDLGNSDHRSAPVTELPSGEWLTLDYRFGCGYNSDGLYDENGIQGHSLWPAWSNDRGRTWEFGEPVAVPGALPFVEIERHIIRLPSGRLMIGGNYMELGPDGKVASWEHTWIAALASDDDGRTWTVAGKLPYHPAVIGEATMLCTKSGKLLLLARSEAWRGADWRQQGMLYQSESHDGGATWSEFAPTTMSSMSSPGHLLQLQDGRILCTHASRNYPGSIYATVSHDEGATWDTQHTKIIANDVKNYDSCYPNTGQMADGRLITAWYSNLFGKFFIGTLAYSPDQL